MKAVPYNEAGISYDDFMGDDAMEVVLADFGDENPDFKVLFDAWIKIQAKELGGTEAPPAGTWVFLDGDKEPWSMDGEELHEFVKEQVGSLPVGFWVLTDLHYEAALIPLQDTAEHGGATIHAVAECSFMRICALLAACVVGDPTPSSVRPVKEEEEDGDAAAERLAKELRESENGGEFEFKGHLLLVLDRDWSSEDRQVKVSPHPDDVDRDALWLFIDEHLVDELKSLEPVGTG